ncbi:unnamed protein product [Darwinula stevensoni]|uniref:Solute carrier family 13 member 2 n=1 Tax=Darwinula stevensoni TaxID=69355 RepID=A0A7R9A8K2_9CRUS|nr:unnamed protein product [Darwinula stevensoni]CAG0896406.1 unnamed protein product [Darwinula stevensoni]
MEGRCAYAVLVMVAFWMTDAIPMAITSLMPVFLFPLLGILGTSEVCKLYIRESTIMFLGGIMVALAVEHCNLHQRVALRFLLWIGTSQMWLMLGFMLATMFLSMWITNTATTAMMIPIVEAVLIEIYRKETCFRPVDESPRECVELTHLQHLRKQRKRTMSDVSTSVDFLEIEEE